MNRCVRVVGAVVSAVIVFASATPALAFDRGPHTEITSGALAAEGFGTDASGVAQVDNWFVDLYHELSATKMPHSGHAPAYLQLVTGVMRSEHWSTALVGASTRMHFDNNPGSPVESLRPDLNNTAGITAEWNRLRRATWSLAREARDNNDPAELLAVLGISLHPLQDFYSHTNWIEPRSGHGDVPGADGPGWQERGFGSYPTWFDVPPEEREKVEIYGDATPGHERIHGLWNADGNKGLQSAVNKDWPGRPLYLKAAPTAYFASRQWIEAVRSWVNDEAFWKRAQHYRANRAELDHDREGMYNIMQYSGHWQGQGEPIGGGAHGLGGSLLDLVAAVREYFQPDTNPLQHSNPFGDLVKTQYRARFEKLIERMADRNPAGEIAPVPSSQGLQRAMRIVVLRVLNLHGEGLGDPGPDEADMYAHVGIDGQEMASAIIHGHDDFSFPDPYEPFTWFKAVPAVPDEPEHVDSIEVEIKTADTLWAGTDDDVYLRLSPTLRVQLDKGLYNDFERGDRDTYSVPIDDQVRRGMGVGAIREVQIEKSDDGIAGGWKLEGVKMRVNGVQLYNNQHINRWIEDDHRTWKAPDFVRRTPHSSQIPIWLQLDEDDFLYGENDRGDINPYVDRRVVSTGYTPGDPPVRVTIHGGSKLGGRSGDGDGARITYSLETLTPELMTGAVDSPPPPEPEPGPKPDLIVTAFNINAVTVKNQGEGDAGPFRLLAANTPMEFDGLAAGESETRLFPGLNCNGNYIAFVDDLEQVVESDETNNTKESEPVIC